MFKRLLTIMLLAPALAAAQRGPDVPCPECKDYPAASYPETGWWYNPDEPGTGFNIEVQNGYLLGAYYGFDEEGSPAWYLFQGALQPGGETGFWTLEAELQSYVGGSCFACAHLPVSPAESPGTLSLEFLQRNHASFSISGEHQQFILPLVYGTAVSMDFPATKYPFPDLSGDWTLVVENTESDLPPDWSRGVEIVDFHRDGVVRDDNGNILRLLYSIYSFPGFPEILGVGTLDCELPTHTPGELPECILAYATSYPGSNGLRFLEFSVPFANIGDSRIEAATEDGIRLRAHRLDYD